MAPLLLALLIPAPLVKWALKYEMSIPTRDITSVSHLDILFRVTDRPDL